MNDSNKKKGKKMIKNNLKVVKSDNKKEQELKEKNKALEAAISQIDQNFGKGSVMKLGQQQALDIESVSTGSLSLDIALGIGGLPKGRIIEVYGPESSGKTTLEVIQSRTLLLNARIANAKAKSNFEVSKFELLAVLGELTLEKIKNS